MRFDEPNLANLDTYARRFGGPSYTADMGVVLQSAFMHPNQLPKLIRGQGIKSLEEYVKKWVRRYINGYNRRPSVRTGYPRGTYPDPVMTNILSLSIPQINQTTLAQVQDGHSYLMTIETFLGDILEEYLSTKIHDDGWFCCWGNSIVATDFCSADGDLLQIKNSDNSENSSSNQIRNGTRIIKWSRRVSTREETYNWDKLVELLGVDNFSEADFREYVSNLVNNNPNLLHTNPNTILIDELPAVRQ